MAKGTTKLAKLQNSLARQRMSRREAQGELIDAAVGAGTALALGYGRGKWGKDGAWDIWDGKIQIPWEVAVGGAFGTLGALGFGGAQKTRLIEVGKTSLNVFLNRWAEDQGKK